MIEDSYKLREFVDNPSMATFNSLLLDDADKTSSKKEKPYGENSCMIALFPPMDIANKIALRSPEAEPADNLHVTLVFLGELSPAYKDQILTKMVNVVRNYLKGISPPEIALKGIANFRGTDKNVLIAPVESSSLQDIHDKMKDALKKEGFPVDETYPIYRPHITLQYLSPGQENPISDIPEHKFTVPYATIAWGNDKTKVPFGS